MTLINLILKFLAIFCRIVISHPPWKMLLSGSEEKLHVFCSKRGTSTEQNKMQFFRGPWKYVSTKDRVGIFQSCQEILIRITLVDRKRICNFLKNISLHFLYNLISDRTCFLSSLPLIRFLSVHTIINRCTILCAPMSL